MTSIAQGIAYWRVANEPSTATTIAAVLSSISGLLVLAGAFTPASSTVVALCLLVMIGGSPEGLIGRLLLDRTATVCLAVVAVALVSLGPGAFAVDAWWFGRREIVFRDRSNTP